MNNTWARILVCALAGVVLSLGHAVAGPDTTTTTDSDPKAMASVTPPSCGCIEKNWLLELGSGVLWSNVRSGEPNRPYTVLPISLKASLKIDDVSLDNELGGILRGYTSFFFRADYDDILKGPESHYESFIVGPTYNFVQPNWRVIPYAEGGVGITFADSQPQAGGLGQDFNFTFLVGAGARYCITDDFFVRLGVEYQHVSNAGLSEPENPNHPIDALGPKLSFGYAF